MYKVLLQRSTGSKEHLTRLSLCSLLSCLSLPLIGPRRPVRASDWMLLFSFAPVEHRRMYELLVVVIGHLGRKIVLLLLCSYAPLEEDKMYKPL